MQIDLWLFVCRLHTGVQGVDDHLFRVGKPGYRGGPSGNAMHQSRRRGLRHEGQNRWFGGHALPLAG